MKFLNCLFCTGELDIVGEEGFDKIVKCRNCTFTSVKEKKKEPEVIVVRSIKR